MDEELRRISGVIKSLDGLGKSIRQTEPPSPDNALKHMYVTNPTIFRKYESKIGYLY